MKDYLFAKVRIAIYSINLFLYVAMIIGFMGAFRKAEFKLFLSEGGVLGKGNFFTTTIRETKTYVIFEFVVNVGNNTPVK